MVDEEDQQTDPVTPSWVRQLQAWMRPWAATPLVPIVCVLIAVVVIRWFAPVPQSNGEAESVSVVLGFFRALWENLPLSLPILSTLLSLMLNVRDIIRPHGWLKVSLPAALGLVSFSIWYVVAAQSTSEDFIRIGQQKVLAREYAVLLLVMAFIWAGFAALGRVLGETRPESERGWRWYGAQALILVVSLVGLSVPFFLFEPKSAVETRLQRSLDESEFSVSIPFRDASLDQHLGRSATPVTQNQVFRVRARTTDDAVAKAKELFGKSENAGQKYGRTREGELGRPVEVVESWIVAERLATLAR